MKNFPIEENDIEFIKSMILFLQDKNEAQARYWCKRIGHPFGVAWFNNGFEPDMTCKGCYEDLG